MNNRPIRIEISARHIHLAPAELARLFGEGFALTAHRALSQPGQFLAEERLRVEGSKGAFDSVAVLGPVRGHTQVELAGSDARRLGIDAPVRLSGDIKDSAAVRLVGPKGAVNLAEGAIIAKRHLHLSPADAQTFGLHDGDEAQVRVGTNRSLVFEHVTVRVSADYISMMHIDVDEANAAGLHGASMGELLL